MEKFLQILNVVGLIETIIFAAGLIIIFISWVRGILPTLWRLGCGLSGRKIAIFAKSDSLVKLLIDSGLFPKRNIIEITEPGDIGRAERATVFLVDWDDFSTKIDEILGKKSDSTGLVIYAKSGSQSIPSSQFVALNNERNVSVTNFRGRLLNDIVTTMITTSYAKKRT